MRTFLLAVGSTLAVFPAAAQVDQHGGAVVIVNGGPTEMDPLADVVVNGSISERPDDCGCAPPEAEKKAASGSGRAPVPAGSPTSSVLAFRRGFRANQHQMLAIVPRMPTVAATGFTTLLALKLGMGRHHRATVLSRLAETSPRG